jgi:hypothetical protein
VALTGPTQVLQIVASPFSEFHVEDRLGLSIVLY